MMRGLLGDRKGAAAAEMALTAPFMILLLFGSVELGNYFYNNHILKEGLRDAAIYVSRQQIDNFTCPSTVNPTLVSNAQTLVRKGSLNSSDPDLLGNWGAAGASFNITMTCETTMGTESVGGIYSANFGVAPVITLTAVVPYRPIATVFGIDFSAFDLMAEEQATVMAL